MTLPKVLMVSESPKSLMIGTSRAYAIDFSDQGTPDDAGTSELYDSDGGVADELTGSASIDGNIVTTKKFTPTTEGVFRLVQTVTISGQLALGVVDISVHAAIPPSAAAKTIEIGAYGSLDQVGSLVPRYANRSGTFDDTTRPVVSSVVLFINQISSMVDAIMAQEGFVTPVTFAAVKTILDNFICSEVAAIVEGINGSGRYGPTTKTGQGKKGRFALVFDDVRIFIESMAIGFERMGLTRSESLGSGIGYRDADEGGDAIFPIRQRDEFGSIWINWDQ